MLPNGGRRVMVWECTQEDLVTIYLPMEIALHLSRTLENSNVHCIECDRIKNLIDAQINRDKEIRSQNAERKIP